MLAITFCLKIIVSKFVDIKITKPDKNFATNCHMFETKFDDFSLMSENVNNNKFDYRGRFITKFNLSHLILSDTCDNSWQEKFRFSDLNNNKF